MFGFKYRIHRPKTFLFLCILYTFLAYTLYVYIVTKIFILTKIPRCTAAVIILTIFIMMYFKKYNTHRKTPHTYNVSIIFSLLCRHSELRIST